MSRGRGRGRGSGLTFNAEVLGVGRDSLPSSVLSPPPKYPPLLMKPSPILLNDEQRYMLQIQNEFLKRMKLNRSLPNSSKTPDFLLEWKGLPKELVFSPLEGNKSRKRTNVKRSGPKSKISKKLEDITSKLDSLEEREKRPKRGTTNSKDDDADEEREENEEEEKEGSNKEEEEEEDDDDMDEELDEGTDYANNYFDNGEGYLDEDDDNLDEGGIY